MGSLGWDMGYFVSHFKANLQFPLYMIHSAKRFSIIINAAGLRVHKIFNLSHRRT